ncbi:MAG TPA: hypothetical protein DD376_05010, partial [Sutterella sp.]|nr:hypothetical protein [Sutterella sp.]
MKDERTVFERFFEHLFPIGENAVHLTDPRRGAKPEVDRLAGVLSVLAYDDENGVFLLNSGGQTPATSLGRVLEINPVLWADESLAAVFERLLRIDFPTSTTLSFSLYASPCIEKTLTDYVTARNRCQATLSPCAHELIYTMAEKRAEHFRAMAKG